jgi:hypothetical protein
MFEVIRQGVIESTEPPVAAAVEAETEATSVGFEPPCELEAKARLFLSGELDISQAAIDLAGGEKVDWPNASLGCPEEGQVYAEVIVPGYRLVLGHDGETTEVHTNRDGSQLATCG